MPCHTTPDHITGRSIAGFLGPHANEVATRQAASLCGRGPRRWATPASAKPVARVAPLATPCLGCAGSKGGSPSPQVQGTMQARVSARIWPSSEVLQPQMRSMPSTSRHATSRSTGWSGNPLAMTSVSWLPSHQASHMAPHWRAPVFEGRRDTMPYLHDHHSGDEVEGEGG